MSGSPVRFGPLLLTVIVGACLMLPAASAVAQIAPQFSRAPGFHAAPFDLELVNTTPGTVIRYTLDGSEPDEDSPIYEGPIRVEDGNGRPAEISLIPTAWEPFWFAPPETAVFTATVVRARAFAANGASPVSTGTFLVDENGRGFSLPVVSLVTDAANFFDYDTGIYVPGRVFDENFDDDRFFGNHPANYNQRGVEWERPVHLEFFETAGGLAFRQDLGVRTHGGATRAFHLKALRLYSRNEYGPSTITYPMFGEDGSPEHKRLLLRPSGNDLFLTMLRDAYVQSLVRHLNFETQAYRPAVVFVNGEYWGIHNIRERYDDHYLSLKYDIPREDIVILGTDAEIDVGTAADSLDWVEFRHFVRSNDLADPSVRSIVKETIDVDSHIDYHVAQIFICNIDWPGNNVRYWRSRNGDGSIAGPRDGRWRWMLFDTDLSTANEPSSEADCGHLDAATRYSDIFPNLLEADWYRIAFLNRFADHLNSTFRAVRTVPHLDSMQAVIAPEMPNHIARWSVPADVATWVDFVEDIRQFMRDRPGHIWQQLVDHFELGGAAPLTIDVSDPAMGFVGVNHLVVRPGLPGLDEQDRPYPWTPWYFKNVPVSITARANPGYRFARWEGIDETDATVSIALDSTVTLRAVFEVDDASPIRPPAHALANGPYEFDHWNADEPDGSFPANMVFLQSDRNDPGLRDEPIGPYHIPVDDYAPADSATIGFPYNTTTRTRINGLGEDGIGLINTGRGRDLGAVVLAVNTLALDHVTVTWTGGTLVPNSRVYAIRLQYRVGAEGPFQDVLHGGAPVEYMRRPEPGHSEVIGPVWLPPDAVNEPYVQLRWKYYFTGERLDETSGQRDMLRIDDIIVSAADAPAPAAGLRFDELHPAGQVGRSLIPFEVSARREDGTIDVDYPGTVTLSLVDDEGVLRGTTTRAFSQGVALFDDIVIDGTIGPVRIRAKGTALSETISTPVHLLEVTELVMPRYVQGQQPENLDRVPFAFLLRIEGLIPEREYRYGNRIVTSSDPEDQNGAGNAFYQTEDGSFVRNTDAPRFHHVDHQVRHGTFSADADGRFVGWFITEPTGNPRFTPGSDVYVRILLNDGNDGVTYHHYLTSATPVRVTAFGDDDDDGSAVMGIGPVGAGHVAVMYDAEHGGTAIAAVPVEPTGLMLDDRVTRFYLDDVLGHQGRFGALVPNQMPSGIRRIELRRLADGAIVRSDVRDDGQWGETDTVEPRNGVSSVLTIVLDDAAGPLLLEPVHETVVREPLLVWEPLEGQLYEVELATEDRFESDLLRFTEVREAVLEPGDLEVDIRHFWRVRGTQPRTAWSAVHAFTRSRATSVDDPSEEAFFAMNFPNPFAGPTTIAFFLHEPSHVRIEIFDMLGRSARVLLDERRPSGRHEVAFDGGGLPSGVYLYRVTSERGSETGTMLLVR
jgi:hypothetical protein